MEDESKILDKYFNKEIERIINIEDESEMLDNYFSYKIDTINIYETYSKYSNYFKITNKEVKLYRIDDTDDWLYCYITNDMNGYIYIYDISKESFYGDFEENERSYNYYRMQLIKEYELLLRHSNVKRYGPLLEIFYNNNTIKFWNSFTSQTDTGKGRYRRLLLEYYEEYNEIIIQEYYYEGISNKIFNLKLNDFVCEIGNYRFFNESRNAVFAFSYPYGNVGVDIQIFLINNGNYIKVKEIFISEDYYNSLNGYWENNEKFKIIANSSKEDNIFEMTLRCKGSDFEFFNESEKLYPFLELERKENENFELKINWGP
jgi:hypothetical protein